MPKFKDLMKGSSIFRDKEVLSPHYVPDDLLFREKEITRLMTAILPALKNERPHNIFVYGKTGTGKTATLRRVLQELSEENNERIKAVYMNCRVYDSRYKVLQKCISDFNPDFAKTGFSFSVLYEKVLDWVEGTGDGVAGKHLIVALDEIDSVKDLDSLIYTLTRANDDLKNTRGSVSIIGISNKVNFKSRLDTRSRSSLCEEEMVFQPYNAEQLRGILKQRLKDAFQDEAVVEESAVNLAAAVAAGENGDARYALNLLLRAGEIAEEKGGKVSDKEVERARKMADEDKAYEVISSLPEHQQILLLAIAGLAADVHYKKLFEENGEKFYFSGEVYEKYCSIVKRMGKEPRTARWYREYLNDLETAGLINTIQSGKGVRGHTTLVRMGYEADKVRKIIERTLTETAA